MVIYLLSFVREFDIEFKRSVIGSVFSVDTTKERDVSGGVSMSNFESASKLRFTF